HTEKCRSCPYFTICRGGCRRHREQPGTEPGENYFCQSYKMFFDACLPRMREIAARLQSVSR
ncbi:MAG: SPASM domain-containing protein, partial [Acetatifactor sp.]|nr:SPASM domain-containing protein [Acetatifactor sp.]